MFYVKLKSDKRRTFKVVNVTAFDAPTGVKHCLLCVDSNNDFIQCWATDVVYADKKKVEGN